MICGRCYFGGVGVSGKSWRGEAADSLQSSAVAITIAVLVIAGCSTARLIYHIILLWCRKGVHAC